MDILHDHMVQMPQLLESLLEREKEKDILLTLSNEIAQIQDKQELLPILQRHLGSIGFYTDLAINILNEDRSSFRKFLGSTTKKRSTHSSYTAITETSHPYPDGFVEITMKSREPLIFHLEDLLLQDGIPSYIQFLYDSDVREMISIGLWDQDKDIGGLFLFSETRKLYTDQQLKLVQGIASQIGTAVAKILASEARSKDEKEKEMLLSLSSAITSCRTKEDVQEIITKRLAPYFQHNELMVCLNNPDNLTHSTFIHLLTPETISHPDFARGSSMKYFINDGIFNIIEESTGPVVFDMDELIRRTNKPFYINFWHNNQVKEIIGFPLRMNNRAIGGATLYPKKKNTFSGSQLALLQAICAYIGIALSNIQNYEKIEEQLAEIQRYKSQLEEENLYLQEQIKATYNFGEVIGWDNGLKNVIKMVTNVGPSTSTVLIQGETGTGKEGIARAIHHFSPRRNKPMIKINCAALPDQLIESELFGHERGSFTGATERRIGKFELAHGSTLFLDEIGEMAPELQVKLLRAIQEKEIERIGGKGVIKTDVRIVAATNRDLQQEVEKGRFRSDLYYRLNVFPIFLPPLRDRMEDIPALVSHFLDVFSRKTGKTITNVSPDVIREIMLYPWPGNIRELEHVLERSVLMTTGTIVTSLFLPQPGNASFLLPEEGIRSLEQNEREYILGVLKKTRGRVRGAGGAAELLNIPPTTLHSKMKKLGIRKVVE